MEKKELWVALSALTVAATGADAANAGERAGVAAQLNPAVKGQLKGEDSRVLFVGSDVFRDEVIQTDAGGQTHLMFLDQSSLTVGPNSKVVIDRFVYNPDTDTGELTVSATKGVLRFVGGALSKTGKVGIKTPVGSLGIRGGVGIIDIAPADGKTVFCFLYGDEGSAKSSVSGDAKSTREHERCLVLLPDGRIEERRLNIGLFGKQSLQLWGPELGETPKLPQMPYTADMRSWWRGEDREDKRSDAFSDEQDGIWATNADIDALAS